MTISLLEMLRESNESRRMSDDLISAIITALVTGIISIIGFVVTNNSIKKNFRNELKQQRDNMALEKMSAMPYEVFVLMDEMFESRKGRNETQSKRVLEQNSKHFKEIMNTIYSYGSEKSIETVSFMQKEIYDAKRNDISLDRYRLMSLYVLLATQIKYDITEISVSPGLWFQMRLSDYEANKDKFKYANNQLIDELKLRNEFRIR